MIINTASHFELGVFEPAESRIIIVRASKLFPLKCTGKNTAIHITGDECSVVHFHASARIAADSGFTRSPHLNLSVKVNESYYSLSCLRVSTTDGSASVLVSPRLSTSPAAILVSIRRMILPLLVLGSASENCIRSGLAIGPISLRT